MAIVDQCKAWIEQDTEGCGYLDKTKTWEFYSHYHTAFIPCILVCLLSDANIQWNFRSRCVRFTGTMMYSKLMALQLNHVSRTI